MGKKLSAASKTSGRNTHTCLREFFLIFERRRVYFQFASRRSKCLRDDFSSALEKYKEIFVPPARSGVKFELEEDRKMGFSEKANRSSNEAEVLLRVNLIFEFDSKRNRRNSGKTWVT